MDKTLCRDFFTKPTHPYHRQYEALRAVFVEQRSQKDVAETFGYSYDSLRQLVCQFRRDCGTEQAAPFFETYR